ncbi:hypothetical protein M407DRAFT_241762 [Tulasnella calospora MUT 4182]|uniref:Uncharacterized protein n=1 Tax=Tulasnella calospora MUT 4182 TaxID=1051891 RepID=A0A0C3QTH1_9AGAM|nr:hypothetical protein M407DRAFT_241762 [Tulasnella calospora MUT 4182]
MLFTTPLVTLLAIVGSAIATPLVEVPEANVNHLEARVAADNMVQITSTTDYCMIVPRNKKTDIGDSEQPGGMKTYCSKPTSSLQGTFASNFWKKVTLKQGKGKNGKDYIQLTGCINTTTCDRLNPSDGGGQYDSSGGSGGKGNPQDSQCTGYASYVELIEPADNRACIRCCQDKADCPTNKDTQGCPAVIPGTYTGCD